ncbi:MAG: hypothetical protein OEY38_18985 [Gammaproteobacteria bacterium]|nr:hypothetical protein [Gammaproteobacteria bacterium]
MRIFLSTLLSVLLFSSLSYAGSELPTLDNWVNNGEIRKVRDLYSHIQTQINENVLSFKSIKYDMEDKGCATYPIKEKSIYVGEDGFVKKMSVTQIISHREPLLLERYYDDHGHIRFVFTKRVGVEVRIYFSAEGVLIWSVEKNGKEYSKTNHEKGDWETNPLSAELALEFFNRVEGCKVLRND